METVAWVVRSVSDKHTMWGSPCGQWGRRGVGTGRGVRAVHNLLVWLGS